MRKIVLFSALVLLRWGMAYAETGNDAIYAWTDGSSTCYQLSAIPKVIYESGVAVLYVNGAEELRLDLTGGAQLKIVFGIYQETPTDVETASLPQVQQVGKHIKGGKLVIVRDGKQYDAHGKRIR
ncbi:MAG: hypothetical protein MJZ75_06750 [Paludibacteraceae bacterium]|nr:hypothetical protein [Paludibacteraceae bacterium]